MIRFAQPEWLGLLALLPALAWLYGRHHREPAFLYSSVQLVKAITSLTGSRAGRLLPKLRWLAFAFFIIALARPQIREDRPSVPLNGVDTVIAVGLSKGMVANEMDWDGRRLQRLLVVRSALEEYLAWGARDRAGLVVFSKDSYIASPLTTHHAFLLARLDQAGPLCNQEAAALGSALLTSLNRLRSENVRAKSVLVIADDSINPGTGEGLSAIGAARALRTTIHGVVLGQDAQALSAASENPKVPSASGAVGKSNPLKRIAQETGGVYGRATNGTALRALLREIHERHDSDRAQAQADAFTDAADWAMAPGLFLLLLETILAHTVWRKLP